MELTEEEKVNLLSILLTPSSQFNQSLFFAYSMETRESVRQLLYDTLHELKWSETKMGEITTPTYNEPMYQCEFDVIWRGLRLLTITVTYKRYDTSAKHVTVKTFCHAKKHTLVLQKSTEDNNEWSVYETVIFSFTVYYERERVNSEGILERKVFCFPEVIQRVIRKGIDSVLHEICPTQPLINPMLRLSYT